MPAMQHRLSIDYQLDLGTAIEGWLCELMRQEQLCQQLLDVSSVGSNRPRNTSSGDIDRERCHVWIRA